MVCALFMCCAACPCSWVSSPGRKVFLSAFTSIFNLVQISLISSCDGAFLVLFLDSTWMEEKMRLVS